MEVFIARGKFTGGRQFKKGVVTNPNGRPPTPPDIKQARQLNRIEFERLINVFMHMDAAALRAFRQDSSRPVIEHIIASIAEKAVAQGDSLRLNFLTEQLFGKLPNKTELSGTLSLEQIIAGANDGST